MNHSPLLQSRARMTRWRLMLCVGCTALSAAGAARGGDDIAGTDRRQHVEQNPSRSAIAEETGSAFPFEIDPEQRAAALEEFQAITDRTTEIQIEEMPAYWRLLQWVHLQPLASLAARSQEDFTFQDLVHKPDANRGRLLRLRLNVGRVLSYEVPENPTGLRRLYEVWGRNPRTGKWLYVAVTPELPDGFPQGAEVNTQATIHGYFFKLQGYLEATATPRAQPIPAPLFLARLEWQPSVSPPAAGSETLWMLGIAAVAGLFLGGRIAMRLWGRRQPSLKYPLVTRPIPTTDQWWQTMQAGNSSAVDAGSGRGE